MQRITPLKSQDNYIPAPGERDFVTLDTADMKEPLEGFIEALANEVRETLEQSQDEWSGILGGYFVYDREELDETSIDIQEVNIDVSGEGQISVVWIETSHEGCKDMNGYKEHLTELDFQFDVEKGSLKILGAVNGERSTADEL